jgi:hypothetical protein
VGWEAAAERSRICSDPVTSRQGSGPGDPGGSSSDSLICVYGSTWLNRPPTSPPCCAGQSREPDQPADFIREIMKCAWHFQPFEPENRINRGRFNQVLLYLRWMIGAFARLPHTRGPMHAGRFCARSQRGFRRWSRLTRSQSSALRKC